MKKRLFSLIFTLTLALALFPATARAATTRCGVTANWQEWTSADSLPSGSGYYYLSSNVTLSSVTELRGSRMYLDLSGYTIDVSAQEHAFLAYDSAIFYLYDSSESSTGCIKNASGSAVYLQANSRFYQYGGSISNNSAQFGGGVYVESGIYSLYGGAVCSNTASADGGGIYLKSGTVNLYGGDLSANSAENGGGMLVESAGTVFLFEGAAVHNNTVKYLGGGIAIRSGSINMTAGQINQNKTTSPSAADSTCGGGALACWNSSSITITGGEFCENTSAGTGGAILIINSSSRLARFSVSGNQSGEEGGGISFCNCSKSIIDGVTLTDNSSQTYGGGISVRDTALDCSALNASGNAAADGGAGMFFDSSSGSRIVTTTVEGNTTGGYGAGILVSGDSDMELSKVTVGENYVTGEGAYSGIYAEGDASVSIISGYFDINNTYEPSLSDEESTVRLFTYTGDRNIYALSLSWGETLSSVTPPTRTGYTFNGYFDARSEGTQYFAADGSVVKTVWDMLGDETLYAQWTAKSYTVNLDAQGGSGGTDSVTVTYDADMPEAVMPVLEDHVFAGYFDASGNPYYRAD